MAIARLYKPGTSASWYALVPFKSLLALAYVACSLSANWDSACMSGDNSSMSLMFSVFETEDSSTSGILEAPCGGLFSDFSKKFCEEAVLWSLEFASDACFFGNCSRSASTAKLKNMLLWTYLRNQEQNDIELIKVVFKRSQKSNRV